MVYFSLLADYCSNNKKSVFITLVFFHIVVSIFLFGLAHTEYFSSFHNGEGLWNFTGDSLKYQAESIKSVFFLEEGRWSDWWNLYPDHKQVRLISLIYWITGSNEPILFSIITRSFTISK